MTVEEGAGEARQASIGGFATQLAGRASGLVSWVGALVLPALSVFGTLPWAWSLFSPLLVLTGLLVWAEAVRTRQDTSRLRQSGRPAVAEVVAAERTDPGDGSPDVAVLTLRISGADVPSFGATYRCDHDARFKAGARFLAVVDPSDNLFTLRPLRTARTARNRRTP